MNPIYKFELTANGTTQRAFPIYKDDLAKDFEKESGQEFFRAKLSGNLKFESEDYTFIVSKAFDTQFVLEIFISYNAGQSWTSYWRGTFWKTDCDFDSDAKTVVVQPTVWDQYNDVLAGMDKEYNLIELAPEIVPVKADKRPMVQVYVPGQSVIGCFLSGMWWEQECTPESDENKLSEIGDGKLNFSLNKTILIGDVSGQFTPALPDIFTGVTIGGKFDLRQLGTQTFTNGNYALVYDLTQNAEDYTVMWSILQTATQQYLFRYQTLVSDIGQVPLLPQTLTLTPIPGSGATGSVSLYLHEMPVYARFICDTQTIITGNSTLNTHEIPVEDIVENNRNYHYVIGYNIPNTIIFSTTLVSIPTQWGIYQPGQYYFNPADIPSTGLGETFPVARNAWGRVSIWFTFSVVDWLVEESGRQSFMIRHAYPLSSVISVLLAKIAPEITHEATTDYSQFLYGTNLIGITQTLLITPKSNLVMAGYDQPAQKAPITLKNVTDMLRNCFRCYWFIDDQNRFRVEHIQYFRNGGSYSGSPIVGIDLTTQKIPRNGKEWAFARNQYKFDKPEMAARYQFGWMDDVTQLFEGFPIDIISKYVNPDNIEQIDISKFTSDIDYILLNPSTISKDGFVLLAAQYESQIKTSWLGASEELQCYYNSSGLLVQTTAIPSTKYGAVKLDVSTFVGLNLRIDVFASGNAYCGFVDNNNNIISSWNGTSARIRTVPGTAKYLLLSNNFTQRPSPTVRYDGFYLPYFNYIVDGEDHYLQNALVAFCILQRYYAFDMPARNYSINGVQMYAQGIKKLKKQTLRFPVLNDLNLVQLVKTNLGEGAIEELSVNLSSRNANATLKYDTE